MYEVGGGATIRFFQTVLGPLLMGDLTALFRSENDGMFSSVGVFGPAPPIERLALAAYPELSEFMVLERLNDAASDPFSTGVAVGFIAAFAASCLLALSAFLSSLDCSPGHSAG